MWTERGHITPWFSCRSDCICILAATNSIRDSFLAVCTKTRKRKYVAFRDPTQTGKPRGVLMARLQHEHGCCSHPSLRTTKQAGSWRRLLSQVESAELAEKPNQKQFVFDCFCTRGTIRVCFFRCFPSAGHLRAALFFLVQNRCFYPKRPFASLATFLDWTCTFCPFPELGTCIFVNHDDWDWSDPRTLLGVPSPPSLSGGPPAAGRQQVFSWVASVLSSSHTCEAWTWSAIAGAKGAVAVCSRLGPPVPGPHGDRGHTCRTPPWACSVSRKSEEGTCRTRMPVS